MRECLPCQRLLAYWHRKSVAIPPRVVSPQRPLVELSCGGMCYSQMFSWPEPAVATQMKAIRNCVNE